MIIAAILQIVLFFKIWNMTNDISKMRKKYLLHSSEDILKEIIKGNKCVESLLYDGVYEEYKSHFLSANSPKSYEKTRLKYDALYKKAGLAMPEILVNIKSKEDFQKVFRTV